MFVKYILFSVDISLYQGEDQLDEIEQRRKREAKKKSGKNEDDSEEEKPAKKEVRIKVKPPKKPVVTEERVGRRVEKRKSAEKAQDAMGAFEFDEDSDEEDEVKQKPKKRKSAETKKQKGGKLDKEPVQKVEILKLII